MRPAIRTAHDLANYGINFLTGESCAYMMRMLFDLSAKGKKLIESFLGVAITSESWNPLIGTDPAVASILLPHEILGPLATFILFENGADFVYESGGAFTSYTTSEWNQLDEGTREYLLEHGKLWKNFAKYSTAPHVGGRNVHQMSGRKE